MNFNATVRLLFVCLLGIASAANARTVYVSTAGSDSKDGLSWGTAKKTVQAGLDAAASGDQVWVAAGIYFETIQLRLGIALYGGFAGCETSLSGRNWWTNETTVWGGIVTAPAGATTSTRIDGFIICNSEKGGILCIESSPTIVNNTITYNGESGKSAVGISCSSSSPIITNNTITGNYGGGILCLDSSPTITNNTITGNYGSGILCLDSSPAIINNDIRVNFAGSGGGIYCQSSSPTISKNTIIGNGTIGGSGGGIYCHSSSPTITNNTIFANNAFPFNRHYGGGGIYCQSSSPTITNNTITGNMAEGYGGGIYCGASSPAITNNTITSNAAVQSTDYSGYFIDGGGIYSTDSARPTITNTIIALNTSGICCASSSGTPTVRYCCVYGNGDYNFSGLADPTGTDGNISADPLFVAIPNAGPVIGWTMDDNLPTGPHLAAGSRCINAGDDTAIQAGWTDIDGEARVQGTHVDIGADESGGLPQPLTVAISSPTNGQTFTTSPASVTGTAARSPSSGVVIVEVRVNGGAWQTADGNDEWSRTISLSSGTNRIEARSRDYIGNNSAMPSVTVTYTPDSGQTVPTDPGQTDQPPPSDPGSEVTQPAVSLCGAGSIEAMFLSVLGLGLMRGRRGGSCDNVA